MASLEYDEKCGPVKRTLPPLVSKAAELWLTGKKQTIAVSTAKTYEAAIKHLKTEFGGMLISDLSPDDVATYQERRTREKAAPATVNKELVCLGSILRHCRLYEEFRGKVKLRDVGESKGRALDPQEEIALLAEVSMAGEHQGSWSPVYTVTVLGLNTGMRHSEIRRVKWKQIDLSARVLRVGKSKSEAGAGRSIPLTQSAHAALDMWASKFPNRKPEDYVFPACEHGHVDPSRPVSNWRTAWSHACERANLSGLGFHSLRHSAATRLLEAGVPFAVVANILGWAPSTAVRMAKVYGHIRLEVQRAALDGIDTMRQTLAMQESKESSEGGHKSGHSEQPAQKSNLPI